LALIYLSPALIILTVFVFYPIILNFYNSAFNFSSFSIVKNYVGFENYKKLFSDPVFYTALKNNFVYTIISLVVQVGGGLVLAAILQEKFIKKFQPFFRTVLFLPSILAFAIVGLLWQMLYQPDIGAVNNIIR